LLLSNGFNESSKFLYISDYQTDKKRISAICFYGIRFGEGVEQHEKLWTPEQLKRPKMQMAFAARTLRALPFIT